MAGRGRSRLHQFRGGQGNSGARAHLGDQRARHLRGGFPSGYRRSARARRSATATSRCARRPHSPPARRRSIGRSSNRAPCLRTSRRAGAGIRAAADRRSAGAPIAGRSGSVRPDAIRHPAAAGRPMSLYAPGVQDPHEDDAAFEPSRRTPMAERCQDGEARRRRPATRSEIRRRPRYTLHEPVPPGVEEHVPLGPPRDPSVTASVGPVEVKPAATLACPLVSALDQWIATAVQPAALRWFRQPVVEIKQISAYSCRGMNGNPNAHISEHAFGNALDIASSMLADGHKVSVQYGWRGAPEEQGFLHDVQVAACNEFTHRARAGRQHLSLQSHPRGSDAALQRPAHMPAGRDPRRSGRRARAVAQYAAQRYGEPSTPARSAGSRSGAPSAIPARMMIVCRPPCPATTEVLFDVASR